MMTVAEAEMLRRAAEKGRSASFCAPGQPHLSLAAAHSSQEISDMSSVARAQQAHAFALLTEHDGRRDRDDVDDVDLHGSGGEISIHHHLPPVVNQGSPRTQLKATHSARRSQSCRVQGSSRPTRREKRRESRYDSGLNLNVMERDGGDDNNGDLDDGGFIFDYRAYGGGGGSGGSRRNSSNTELPFIKKVPSCGRLATLSTDLDYDSQNGSPILRRTASARRALPPTNSSPRHSPTPTRFGARATSSSQKGRSQSRKAPQSNTKRPPGSYLDVKPAAGSTEKLDPDSVLLRNFSTTNKGKYF